MSDFEYICCAFDLTNISIVETRSSIQLFIDKITSYKTIFLKYYNYFQTLLPRGQNPNPLRERISQVNEILKQKLVTFSKVEIVSIDKGFVQPDGTISHHDMHDYLLLTNAGSKKAFEPVHELLLQLLNEGEQEKDLTPSE